MSTDASELSRRRREARQKRILARGTDRLSSIRQTLTRVSDMSSDQEAHSSPMATPLSTGPHSPALTFDGESDASRDQCQPPIDATIDTPALPLPKSRRPDKPESLESDTPVVSRPPQRVQPSAQSLRSTRTPPPATTTAQVFWRVQWRPALRFCAGLLPTLALFAYTLFVEWTNDAVLGYWDTPSKLGLLLVEPPSAVLGDWTHAFPLVWCGLVLQTLWYAGQCLVLPAPMGTPSTASSVLANVPTSLLPSAIQPIRAQISALQLPTQCLGQLVDMGSWLLLLTGVAAVVSQVALAS